MIDGGACVGKITEQYQNTHIVFAFEPNSANFKFLDNKFRHHNNIHPLKLALGKTAGTIDLFIPRDPSGYPSVSSTIVPSNTMTSNIQGKEEVAVISLSQFCRDYGIHEIDILKLDIEGSEYDVLDDLFESGLINKIRAIYVEFHAKACIPSLLNKEAQLLIRLAQEYRGELHIYNWDKGYYE